MIFLTHFFNDNNIIIKYYDKSQFYYKKIFNIVPFDLQDFSVAKKEWRLNFFAAMNAFDGFLRSTHSIEIDKKKRIKSKRDRHFIDFVDLFVYFNKKCLNIDSY